MAQTEERFAYFHKINGPFTRIFATFILLFIGFVFLGLGDNAYKIIGPGYPEIESKHSRISQIVGTAFITFGCMGLLWSSRLLTKTFEIIISMDSVSAPSQGIFGHDEQIPFTEITYLKKLSFDGKWEFKIASRGKHIRVEKEYFKVADEFEKFVEIIQKHVPHCKMEIEEREYPPDVGGSSH